MDGHMKYDFGAIEGLSADVNARVNAVETLRNDLEQRINNLTQIWDGAANSSFQQVKQQWLTASNDLNQVLAQIRIAIDQTNSQAQATERRNASRFGG